jgi:hypothetical protein
MYKKISIVLLLLFAAGCVGNPFKFIDVPHNNVYVPPMDATRKVSERICTRPIHFDGGNLLCREITDEERQAQIEEEERLARARKEAAERAERERLERERAKQLALEEAARKQREAEEARRAAEEARKAREERERQERLAAEARARQEAREAAYRECRRREQEWLEARAILANWVSKYGKVDEFEEISGQITAFLKKPRKAKPCTPA